MTPTRADLERLIENWRERVTKHKEREADDDLRFLTIAPARHNGAAKALTIAADELAALLTSEGPAPATLTDALIDQMLAEVHAATLDAQSAARGMGLPVRERYALVSDSRRLTVRSFLSQARIIAQPPAEGPETPADRPEGR
jgi:hypothetical protein